MRKKLLMRVFLAILASRVELASIAAASMLVIFQVIPSWIASIALLLLAALLIYSVRNNLAMLSMPPKVGMETLLGADAIAVTQIKPVGYVRVQGEVWKAHTEDAIEPEETVVIHGMEEGLILKVSRKPENRYHKKHITNGPSSGAAAGTYQARAE